MRDKSTLRPLHPTEQDLIYNRRGQISPYQRDVLTSARRDYVRNMLMLMLGLGGAFLFIGLLMPQPWGVLVILIVGVPLLLLFVKLTRSIGSAPAEDVRQVMAYRAWLINFRLMATGTSASKSAIKISCLTTT